MNNTANNNMTSLQLNNEIQQAFIAHQNTQFAINQLMANNNNLNILPQLEVINQPPNLMGTLDFNNPQNNNNTVFAQQTPPAAFFEGNMN